MRNNYLKLLSILILYLLNSCMSLILSNGQILSSEQKYNIQDTMLLLSPTVMTHIYDEKGKYRNDIKANSLIKNNLQNYIDSNYNLKIKKSLLDSSTQNKIDGIIGSYALKITDLKRINGIKIHPDLIKLMDDNNTNYLMAIVSLGWSEHEEAPELESSLELAGACSRIYCIIFDKKNNEILFFGEDIEHATDPAN